jgi:hypothetical protein
MRSGAATKARENRGYQPTTPHNPALRIIGTADVDPVARCVVVGSVSLGDDSDALGLKAQCNDFALEAVLGQLATVFLK